MRSSFGDPVLVLHRVGKSIRAGVPGCTAAVCVLADVDLVVRRGERVAVVGAPNSGKTTLLLVAAGLLASDRGTAWTLAGAVLHVARPSPPRMSVAEAVAPLAPLCGDEALYWPREDDAALLVARTAAHIVGRVDRVLHLERARLRASAGVVGRVDSPLGPP